MWHQTYKALGPRSVSSNWLLPASHTISAKQSMIAMYPRPDGETNTFARHRKAFYDGTHPIQYRIPVGVGFGRAPFNFQLTAAPSGMAIGANYGDANYGFITWTPSGSVTNATVTVRVTDQDLNTLDLTWTVSTSSSTADFIFVDAVSGNDSTGSGSITAPFATLSKAFGSTFSATANASSICYLRAGTYSIPGYSDNDITAGSYFEMHTTRKPSALIGYPGETVTLDCTTGRFASNGNGADLFMQDILPSGFQAISNYRFMWRAGQSDRETFSGIIWTGAGFGTAGSSSNATMFFGGDLSSTTNFRKYTYFHNSSESGRTADSATNSYAFHSMYSCQFGLTEWCVVSATSFDAAFYLKGTNKDWCCRYNTVIASSGGDRAFSTGFDPDGAPTRIEICYNRVKNTLVTCGTQAGSYGSHWIYRNSILNGQLKAFDGSTGGPYVFENNAVVTNSSPIVSSGSQLTNTGTECQGATALGILDTSMNLSGTYRTNYLGQRGAEVA